MPTSLIQVGTYSSENFSQQWAAVKANLSLMRTDEHNWSSLASTWLLFIICRISSVKFGFNLFLPHTVKEIGTYTLFQSRSLVYLKTYWNHFWNYQCIAFPLQFDFLHLGLKSKFRLQFDHWHDTSLVHNCEKDLKMK